MKDIDENVLLDEQMPTMHEKLEVRRAFSAINVSEPDVDKEWAKWMSKNGLDAEASANVNADTKREETEPANKKSDHKGVITLLKWTTFAAAACIALAFVIHGLYFSQAESPIEVFTAYQNNNDVILSSDDGVSFNKVKQDTLSFFKSAGQKTDVVKPRMKTVAISIPRGKNFHLILADGTKVFLNADSKIEFPETFTGNERRVRINGEAYMEVTPDKTRPFIVETDYFTTTVLGTVFDVRAYSAKDASLALVSGKVDVCDNKSKVHKAVNPDELLTWNNDGGMTVQHTDIYPLTQWKSGFFYFDKTPLVNIMQELGRWYNVSVVFEKPEDMKHILHFAAERNEDLSNIVQRINDLGVVNAEYEDKVITIY